METIHGFQKLPGLSALRGPDFDRCVETIIQKTWWRRLIRWSGYRAICQTGINWSLYYPPIIQRMIRSLFTERRIRLLQQSWALFSFLCQLAKELFSMYCSHIPPMFSFGAKFNLNRFQCIEHLIITCCWDTHTQTTTAGNRWVARLPHRSGFLFFFFLNHPKFVIVNIQNGAIKCTWHKIQWKWGYNSIRYTQCQILWKWGYKVWTMPNTVKMGL